VAGRASGGCPGRADLRVGEGIDPARRQHALHVAGQEPGCVVAPEQGGIQVGHRQAADGSRLPGQAIDFTDGVSAVWTRPPAAWPGPPAPDITWSVVHA